MSNRSEPELPGTYGRTIEMIAGHLSPRQDGPHEHRWMLTYTGNPGNNRWACTACREVRLVSKDAVPTSIGSPEHR